MQVNRPCNLQHQLLWGPKVNVGITVDPEKDVDSEANRTDSKQKHFKCRSLLYSWQLLI